MTMAIHHGCCILLILMSFFMLMPATYMIFSLTNCCWCFTYNWNS
ncbi:hypothetical protein DSUL_30017 [Desulfovibrionales bacterium]